MTKILLITATEELEVLVAEAAEGFLPFRYDEVPAHPDRVLQQLAELGHPDALPDVMIIDGIGDPGRAIELAAGFNVSHPLINTILVTDDVDEVALPALRAGVRDIVSPSAGPDDLRSAVDRAARAVRHLVPVPTAPSGHRSGRIVTVVSPKGGVGKTTLSTNIAVGIANRHPGAVVLVDLDIQFGDVASALDLEPEYFLQDAVRGQARQDAMALKTLLTEHQTGLYAICAPDSPIEADSISGEDVAELLRTLAKEFRYVVVDTAPGLAEHTLSALDVTTDLVLLTSMEVPGVRGMRKEIDTLTQLGLLPESRQVVINFSEPRSLLTIADIEATIRTGVDHQLPRSKAATDSVNQGVPLLQSGVRDPLTKHLRSLVDRLLAKDDAGQPAPAPVIAPVTLPRPEESTEKQRPRRAASRWSRTRKFVAQ